MNVIRQLRDQVQVTQARLAAMVGTSQSAIAAYESGSKSPTLRTIHRLAAVLGLVPEIRFVASLTREDRRSLAYHQVIAERLLRNPGQIVEKARRNLKRLQALHPHAAHLLSLWDAWLDLPSAMLTEEIMGASELARDMRQVSPFSGLLTAAERRSVLAGFRAEIAA
ncbi:MAG: helix-turn-helix domain-containing protein [Gammaproteobacteria bacterium]|nr:helix-turn-helix domain-containing protein [Gammaproteobacteria bacterium]